MNDKRIYLDYAASTPVDLAVKKAMEPYFSETFANAGALYWQGQQASAAVFKSRDIISKAIGAQYNEIIFTGSATEANNLVLRGVVRAFRFWLLGFSKNGLTAKSYKLKPRIVTSAIEHESVLETCRDLEKEGVELVYIPVNRDGIIDLKKLSAALNDRTILVSIMYVNNEVGTIQPIKEISKLISDFRKQKIENRSRPARNSRFYFLDSSFPLLHTDAVQAFQYLDCDVNNLGMDFVTLSAHKIYGPKGIGCLYVSDLTPNTQNLKPIVTGGGQEYGLRSGTENTPAIVGFAKAVEVNQKLKSSEAKRIIKLRDYLLRGFKKINFKIVVNGSMKERIPNNLNVYFPGRLAADLLIKLDLAGFAVSPGAACSARAMRPSYVLEAMGLPHQRCVESLRITLGRQTKKSDLEKFLVFLRGIV